MVNFREKSFILTLLLSSVIAANHCKPGEHPSVSQPFHLQQSGVSALKSGIISGLAVHSIVECGLHCLSKRFCAGHNFKTNANRNQINCQLTISKNHKFEKSKSVEESDWDFYEIVGKKNGNPCEVNPCKNGGKAVPHANPLSYKCQCPNQYEGEHCTVRKVEPLFDKSVILSGKIRYAQQLTQWIGGNPTAKLCWRATRDGWAACTFHSNCDDKAPTVTIVKVGDYLFGGFATASWSHARFGSWKKAPGSFIFSLRNKENLPAFKAPLKEDATTHAIYTSSSFGPTFGNDLTICDNSGGNTQSYTMFNDSYQAPSATFDTSTILAGTYHFTPSEVEVFYMV